jgi:hypothetical protein
MFPKHKDGALSGSAESAGAPVDVRGLISGDLHATLRSRGNARRFALERAEEERGACACSTGGACACAPGIFEALAVPPEVLAALSPAEIAAKTAAKSTGRTRPGGCDCGCACGGQ